MRGCNSSPHAARCWYEPELHRLRAEALAGLDAADPAAVVASERAIEVAGRHGSLVLQRRAEATRARLAR